MASYFFKTCRWVTRSSLLITKCSHDNVCFINLAYSFGEKQVTGSAHTQMMWLACSHLWILPTIVTLYPLNWKRFKRDVTFIAGRGVIGVCRKGNFYLWPLERRAIAFKEYSIISSGREPEAQWMPISMRRGWIDAATPWNIQGLPKNEPGTNWLGETGQILLSETGYIEKNNLIRGGEV